MLLEGARWLQLAVFVLWCLSVQHTAVNAGAQLVLRRDPERRHIPNHGFVRYDQISDYDNRTSALNMYVVGVTNFRNCCNYQLTADRTTIGWWFFPNGTEVPKIGTPEGKTWSVWSSRYTEINLWYRRGEGPMNASAPSGIYHCDIPLSREANMTLYVGIYPGPDGGTGDPNVTSIQISLASEHTVSETLKFNVTCTSEGGPATTVTWTRDGEAVSGDNFTATRTLDDPVTAAYTLTLSVVGRQGGVYRCQVAMGGPGVSGYPVNSSMELTINAANPPTGLTAVQVGNETAQVSWTPPTSSEPVTGYQIYYMTQGTNDAHVIVNVSTPEEKQEIIYGLQVGLTYSITMVALSEHLPSELVGPVNVTILDKPAAPNVTTEITTTSVLLQWTQSDGMNNGPDNFEISFQYTVGSQHEGFCGDYSHSDNITLTNVSTRQYDLTRLQEYSAYHITIRAENGAGKSAPSEIDITTLQTVPSGKPQEVIMTSVSLTNITIQWREVPCIQQNSDITGYTVRYSVPGSRIKNTNVSDMVATLIELTPFTNYSIEVAAFSVNGTGPFSTPIYVETLQDKSGVNISVIAGGAGGGAAVILLLVIIVAIIWTKQRKRKYAVTKTQTSVHFNNEDEVLYCTIGPEEEKRSLPVNERLPTQSCPTESTPTESQPIPVEQFGTFYAVPVNESLPTESQPIPVEQHDFSEPEIEQFPEDVHVRQGQTVLLQVKVKDTPTPTLNWYHDGDLVVADYSTTLDPNGTLQIPSVEPRHAGVYCLVATNTAGSTTKEVKVSLLEDEEPHPNDQRAEFEPIPLHEFQSYVVLNHAKNNHGFKEQYMCLESGDQHPVTVAVSAKNKPLNRFKNIVAYDDNRIILSPIPGFEDHASDYINASYVDGYRNPRAFIATQAPLPKTLTHFWHLVWQEKPRSIFMFTNLKEGNKIKCQKYWPDSGSTSFGSFRITITDQQVFADYTIRKLQVALLGSTEQPHGVTQFHFTEWPDHGVPEYATAVLEFHRRVKSFNNQRNSRRPILVHCSAGVGRTGTFIAIDTALEQMEKENVLDIAGTINRIRQQRMKLVQTVEQYIFIHDAILEVVICGDTQIPTDNIYTAMEKLKRVEHGMTGMESQFHVLNQVTPDPKEVPRTFSLQYSERNRSTYYLPPDKWRVPLKGNSLEYIHATFVNGYKQRKAFIIAEGPMESTCKNFWKMVYERNCGAIVMLSGLVEEGKEECCRYWPENGSVKYGNITVEELPAAGNNSFEGYKVRKFSLSAKSGGAHQVTQFCFENWDPSGRCANRGTILEVIDEVSKVQRRTGNNPIVVHCSDTVGRSGMFCTIATTIERCKTEGVVDVFQVLKAIRGHKPGAVATEEQYSYIFDVVLVYLDSFSTYANFK